MSVTGWNNDNCTIQKALCGQVFDRSTISASVYTYFTQVIFRKKNTYLLLPFFSHAVTNSIFFYSLPDVYQNFRQPISIFSYSDRSNGRVRLLGNQEY